MVAVIEALMPYVLVFGAVFALDFAWAFYTRAVTAGASLKAAFYAGGLIVLTGSAQIGYTHEPVLLIPAALGAFLGTFAALKLTKGAKSESGS